MVLRVAPFDVPMDELASFIESTSPETGGGPEALTGARAELVGPVPAFTADARMIAVGDWSAVEHVGWRALTRRGTEPVAVVDMSGGPTGVSFSQRGTEAAVAFHRALEASSAFEESEESFEVRWLTLPVIYLTAVWLKGDRDEFIPTRLGGCDRVDPVVITRKQLERMTAELVEQAAGSAEAGGAAPSELPDSRSGF